MAVRDILVHLDSPGAIVSLLPAAVQLTRDLGASGLTLAALAEVPAHIGAGGPPSGAHRDQERDLIDLIDRMETRARAAAPNMPIEWRGAVSPAAQAFLARWGVRADLIVMSSPQFEGPAMAAVDVGAAILAAGRPVLVAPRLSPSLRFGRVLIGFKATREGRAALAAAVPLLGRTERVLIASVGLPVSDVRDAAAFLHGHGVRAETTVIENGADQDAGRTLLALADEDRSDLIVTGAYGHSRTHELVFGGVTRTLLTEARLPCLMVH